MADDDTLDLSQPESLNSLTMLVATKLSAEHKWYKVIVENKNPVYLPLYKSLYDHLVKTVGDLLKDATQSDPVSAPLKVGDVVEQQQYPPQKEDAMQKQKIISHQS